MYAFALIAIAFSAFFIYCNFYSGNQQPSSGETLTITYDDGTTQTYDSQNTQGQGLTIIDTNNGRAISSIRIELYITPSFTGAYSYYSFSGGNMRMMIFDNQITNARFDSGDRAFQPLSTLPHLTSGQSVVVSSATLTASQIQSLFGAWRTDTTYKLVYRMSSPLTVTMHFQDGNTASQSATAPSLEWQFKYKANGGLSMANTPMWR